ncbi:MAG TPA: FAD-binding oxidoreductase [Paracoccaceae bacterium]|nr:FAD-binding oxidoreductase [Paracoccaceae bacterium]
MTARPAFAPEMHALRAALIQAVGARHVREDPGPDHGATLIVLPGSTAEVSAVVKVCQSHGASIVPQGGHTGLVGGCQSQPGQVVLSLSRMTRIETINPSERVAVVEAGVALEALQNAALAHGLEPGIDLAARGSATIGGMVSTNAGGIMAFRHGVMRHRILGLEAVLADGSVYSEMTRVIKNTAGYDLKHLFIGAEGTLGIVTRVVLRLEPVRPASVTLLLGLHSADEALEAIALALHSSTSSLRAAEGLWQSYIRLTAKGQGWAEPDFPLDKPIYLLLMLAGAEEAALHEEAERMFGLLTDRFAATTGILASSKRQEEELWLLREDTDQLYRMHAAAPSYDVSVPLSEIGTYLETVLARLASLDGGMAPYVFGHLADGNLHIVLDRAGPLSDDVSQSVENALYADLNAIGGSFSAEHGVGTKRVSALIDTADPVKMQLMRRLKDTLDPAGLLNPGKVLRTTASTPQSR